MNKPDVLSEEEVTKKKVKDFLKEFALPYVGKPANEEWLNVVATQVWIWEGQTKDKVAREIFDEIEKHKTIGGLSPRFDKFCVVMSDRQLQSLKSRFIKVKK